MISGESQINLEILNGLSEEERRVTLEILKQYAQAGSSELLDNLQYIDFEEIPVDIHTFLHEKKYLGNALYDADGRFTVFPYWERCLEDIFPDNLTTKYNNIVFTGAIGLGKAQPLDSLVLCENGFKRMGDLSLSDKVYGNDGELHDILGIFPQGKKKICKVTFTDGTSTLCCDEHLWTVYNTKNQCWTTVETKQLIDGSRNLKHAYGHRYKIPITVPVNFKHKDVIIDPYLFGCLLGDGHIKEAVTFASNDTEIVNNIKSIISEDYEVRKVKAKYSYSICKIKNITRWDEDLHTQVPTPNKYFEAIKKYNLNTTTINKYIPADYLYNDVESRIALLQGLMDTDGYISKDGSLIEFTTISKNLCDDFVSLVQSLGGICHIRTKHPSYKDKNGNKVFCNISYNIGIKLPKSIKPFRLSRKVERLSDKTLEPFRYITNIEYVGEDNCQCIYIDSKEHLYLTNDYIVTHNTLIADIILLYILYRLLCLKDPYLYYGMQPIDKISISFMNITIENAKGVALDKMNQMILSSEWFMAHGEMAGTANLVFRPEKHIELIAASSNNQIVGRALFGNFTDEANFSLFSNPEKQKKKMMKIITQVDARMKSRFMRTKPDGSSYLPTINIIASSKDTEQSFLEEYINNKRENNSQTTLIVDEPQWVVDSRKDSPNKFWVALGDKFKANELLPLNITDEQLDEYRDKGYNLWQVPMGYLETFQGNLDEAICSIIGIATASSLKYIAGEYVNKIKTNLYQNPFVKDVIEVGDGAEDFLQYSNFFDMSRVDPEDLGKPLFIHLDMSTGAHGKGDKTGIAGVWITGKENNINKLSEVLDGNTAAALAQYSLNSDLANDLHYKVAFSVSIKAPKGENISFAKNRNFIRWLREQGFAIKCISMDTFQSAPVYQDLKAAGFNVESISVDRVQKDTTGRPVCLPYHFLKSAIYENRITLYQKCDQLTDELVGLERKSDGHIDHTKQGINCLSGSTKISLVDGREVTIKDLVTEYESGKENYVYTVNEETLKIEPKLIEKAYKSGTTNKLLKITLDNGESIVCTPEHRFMLRNGEYCQAKELLINDSLMPLYRKFPKIDNGMKDYRIYYEPVEDKWHFEHRQFASEVLDEKYLVHHKNCIKTDNSPSNLVWCSKKMHKKIHDDMQSGAQSREANLKRSESLKKWHAENKGTPNYILSHNRTLSSEEIDSYFDKKEAELKRIKILNETFNIDYCSLSGKERFYYSTLYNNIEKGYNIGTRKKAKEKHESIKQQIIDVFNVDYESLSNNERQSYAIKLARLNDPTYQEKISKAMSENHKAGKYENAKTALQERNSLIKELKKLYPVVDKEKFIEMFGFDFYSIDCSTKSGCSKRGVWINRYRKQLYELTNHSVIKIEYLTTTEDVYDLTIKDNHNFALTAGIFVHNSKDQADAVCGAIWAASKYSDEYSYRYGDNLTAALNANDATINDRYNKQQLVLSFEEELKKISFKSMGYSNEEILNNAYTDEMQDAIDISDGIIIF